MPDWNKAGKEEDVSLPKKGIRLHGDCCDCNANKLYLGWGKTIVFLSGRRRNNQQSFDASPLTTAHLFVCGSNNRAFWTQTRFSLSVIPSSLLRHGNHSGSPVIKRDAHNPSGLCPSTSRANKKQSEPALQRAVCSDWRHYFQWAGSPQTKNISNWPLKAIHKTKAELSCGPSD